MEGTCIICIEKGWYWGMRRGGGVLVVLQEGRNERMNNWLLIVYPRFVVLFILFINFQKIGNLYNKKKKHQMGK